MSKLNANFSNLFLKLDDPLRRRISHSGYGKEVLAIRDFLFASEHLQPLPPAMREVRIRKLIFSYLRGRAIGSHIPGFYPFMAPSSSWTKFPDIQLAEGNIVPGTLYPVVQRISQPDFRTDAKLGLHIHAFYVDGLAEIRDRIFQNQTIPDLFITGPDRNKSEVEKILGAYPGKVTFISCGNLGRDVVPFLTILPQMFQENYDLIGHVHIKKSLGIHNSDFVQHWSDYLMASLLGDVSQKTAAIDDIVADYSRQVDKPALYLPHMMDLLGWSDNRALAAEIFKSIHAGPLPERFLFSVGTMFWAQPNYLQPFAKINLPWDQLAKEPLPVDGTVLHAIERLFGALAIADQANIRITPPANIPFVFSPKLVEMSSA